MRIHYRAGDLNLIIHAYGWFLLPAVGATCKTLAGLYECLREKNPKNAFTEKVSNARMWFGDGVMRGILQTKISSQYRGREYIRLIELSIDDFMYIALLLHE